MGSIGFIVAVVGLGLLFEWLSLDAYPAALLVIMAGIVVSSFWVPNAQPVLRPSTLEPEGFVRQLRRPGILAFYLSVGLMQLSNGPYYTFLTLHLEGVGYSRGAIGLFWALGWRRRSCCSWSWRDCCSATRCARYCWPAS